MRDHRFQRGDRGRHTANLNNMPVKNHSLVAAFPSGEEITNPGIDVIKWFMRRPYDKFWLYAPTAILSWQRVLYEIGEGPFGDPVVKEEVIRNCQLTLSKHKRQGWFCLHCKSNEDKWSVPFPSAGDKTAWVEGWMCGETRFFLRDCFVKQKDCDDVVEKFIENGGKSSSIKWKPLSQITPHVSQPPENASHVVRFRAG